jgi:hypothetical protein
MNAGTRVLSCIGSVVLTLTCACTGPIQGGLTDYKEAAPISSVPAVASVPATAGAAAPTSAITAATAHPGPTDVAAVPPPAAATAATPPVAAAPPPAAAPSVPAAPVVTPVAAPTTTAPPVSTFNAGSGTALPDGKTVEYRIPDGTGGTDWNPKDNPIRVKRGMVLRLIDEDKSTRSGGHWLHTNGQPCPHGLKAIGTGFDCNVSMNAPIGKISGVFEHNVANGIGQLHIEVVADKPN